MDLGSICSILQKEIAEQLQVPFHQKSKQPSIGVVHQGLKFPAHPVNLKIHPSTTSITFLLWINSIQMNHRHSSLFVKNINILETSAFRYFPTTQLQCSSVKTSSTRTGRQRKEQLSLSHSNKAWTIAGHNQTSSLHFAFSATIIDAPATSANQLYNFLAKFLENGNKCPLSEITMSKKTTRSVNATEN